MPSTHLSLHYHLVFSTKQRERWLIDPHRARVHEYVGGIVRNMRGVAHAMGGVEDHVHAFIGLRATHCLADVMRELKADSSAWIHRELGIKEFSWQEGYGGFTVSASLIQPVRRYVMNQVEHHRRVAFEDEYVRMLRRGLVEYDDRYLW